MGEILSTRPGATENVPKLDFDMRNQRAAIAGSAVVALACVSVLAGCGGASPTSSMPVAAPTTAAPTVAPTTAAPTTAPPTAAATAPTPAATQAPPQVIVVQPAPVQVQTQYVPVPAPNYGGTYVRPASTFQLILGSSGHPDGPFVPMHTGPNASTAQVQRVYDGEYYSFDCQTYGGPVYGDWGTSYLWDRVVSGGQVLGYISDEWVHTGSDAAVLPSC
jgi:hypothetical protein